MSKTTRTSKDMTVRLSEVEDMIEQAVEVAVVTESFGLAFISEREALHLVKTSECDLFHVTAEFAPGREHAVEVILNSCR